MIQEADKIYGVDSAESQRPHIPIHEFINDHCQIYDATLGQWIPFTLWPEQTDALNTLEENKLTILLKARQLGMTWLVLARALYLMLYRPSATILVFSRREKESKYLLSDERLRGMYQRLPEECTRGITVETDNELTWKLSNGSIAYGFPQNAGDSYTATYAIVDEADLCPDLGKLMTSVKPTIDNGGDMTLLSRSDKSRPISVFKNMYVAARDGRSEWASVFLPWYVHPNRDAGWYDRQRSHYLESTGSEDDLHEQYPTKDVDALSARTHDKRIPFQWLKNCYQELKPVANHGGPAVPGLTVYKSPVPGRQYVAGVDTCEGNPTSDPSSSIFVDKETGVEVAKINGRFQPAQLADYTNRVALWYNKAKLMPERNNHGHTFIFWFIDKGKEGTLLNGRDGRPGWVSSPRGKTIMYDIVTDTAKAQDMTIHDPNTFNQLASIEGSTLRASEGQHDDDADAYTLAQVARAADYTPPAAGSVVNVTADDYLGRRRRGRR